MTTTTDALIIGFDGYKMPKEIVGDAAPKINAAIDDAKATLEKKRRSCDICWVDAGDLNAGLKLVENTLKETQFKVVVVGAGIRKAPVYFEFFERVVNAVHEGAPKSKIAFNDTPMSTVEAIERNL